MSGSIHGSRIPTKQVQPTINNYINEVLSNFEGFKLAYPCGSYRRYQATNTEKPDGHGDIDLAIYIEPQNDETLAQCKRRLKTYFNSLPDNIIVPFRDCTYEGKKAMIFGDIITCGFHFNDEDNTYVQIDNIICNTEKSTIFATEFLGLNFDKQALLMAMMRVVPQKEIINFFNDMQIHVIPQNIEESQRLEIVVSTKCVSLRLVTLNNNGKEIKKYRQTLWSSHNWQLFKYMVHYFYILNLSNYVQCIATYEDMLMKVYNKYKEYDKQARLQIFYRIIGMMKSIINISDGELNTQKALDKEQAIMKANMYLC